MRQNGSRVPPRPMPTEVVILDDDDPPAKEPIPREPAGAGRGRGRAAGTKRPAQGELATGDAPGRKRNQQNNERLSPYFHAKQNDTKQMPKASTPVDLENTECKPSAFGSNVMAVLGAPKENMEHLDSGDAPIEATGISQIEVDPIAPSDDEDELHGSSGIPSSHADRKVPAPEATNSRAGRSRAATKKNGDSSWSVEEFIDNDGKVYKSKFFSFLDIKIHVGMIGGGKYLRLLEQHEQSDDLVSIPLSRIRSMRTSSEKDCQILQILCAGNPAPSHEIKFRSHADMADFIRGLSNVTALKGSVIDKTK